MGTKGYTWVYAGFLLSFCTGGKKPAWAIELKKAQVKNLHGLSSSSLKLTFVVTFVCRVPAAAKLI